MRGPRGIVVLILVVVIAVTGLLFMPKSFDSALGISLSRLEEVTLTVKTPDGDVLLEETYPAGSDEFARVISIFQRSKYARTRSTAGEAQEQVISAVFLDEAEQIFLYNTLNFNHVDIGAGGRVKTYQMDDPEVVRESVRSFLDKQGA